MQHRFRLRIAHLRPGVDARVRAQRAEPLFLPPRNLAPLDRAAKQWWLRGAVPVFHLGHWVSSQLPWSVWGCLNKMEVGTEIVKRRRHFSLIFRGVQICARSCVTSMRWSIRGGRSSRRPFAPIKASRNLASSQPVSSGCFPPLWKYFRLLERWRLQDVMTSAAITDFSI